MAKDIRSISAHDPVLRSFNNEQHKLQTYRNFAYLKPFWPENEYQDKETLYIKLKQSKVEANHFKAESVRMKTKITQCERELASYEKLCEELRTTHNPKYRNQEQHILQLKRSNKALLQELTDKNKLIEQLKRCTKVTRIQELEIESQLRLEEMQRLQEMLRGMEEIHKCMEVKLNQSTEIRGQFNKTQVNYKKSRSEITQLTQKLNKSEEFITQLQSQLNKLNLDNQKLRKDQQRQTTKLQLVESELKTIRNAKSSSQSFRSKTDKFISESASLGLVGIHKQKIQEELQFKLMLRGIAQPQFQLMITELKQQADELQQEIGRDDIQYILTQEPFILQESKIAEILKLLTGHGHKLADSLVTLIGNYQSLHNYPNFSIDKAEQIVSTQLRQGLSKSQIYFQNHRQTKLSKEDVKAYLDYMNFGWDDATYLYYMLSLFEKSGEQVEYEYTNILYPFLSIKQETSKIVEEDSDEDLFDKQSDEYSLDGVDHLNIKSNDQIEVQNDIL